VRSYTVTHRRSLPVAPYLQDFLRPFSNRVGQNENWVLIDLDQCKHCKNSQRAGGSVQKTIIEDVHGDQLI
jgi:hypothetical protein